MIARPTPCRSFHSEKEIGHGHGHGHGHGRNVTHVPRQKRHLSACLHPCTPRQPLSPRARARSRRANACVPLPAGRPPFPRSSGRRGSGFATILLPSCSPIRAPLARRLARGGTTKTVVAICTCLPGRRCDIFCHGIDLRVRTQFHNGKTQKKRRCRVDPRLLLGIQSLASDLCRRMSPSPERIARPASQSESRREAPRVVGKKIAQCLTLASGRAARPARRESSSFGGSAVTGA